MAGPQVEGYRKPLMPPSTTILPSRRLIRQRTGGGRRFPTRFHWL